MVGTQASIASSSGEAEYYGVVRGTGVALGMQALYEDIGPALPIRERTDSSAAIGNGGRQGLCKVRHLECHFLWVQRRLRRRDFCLLKVAGAVNPVDLFTKHLVSQAKLDEVVGLFGCQFMAGRAASAPALKSDVAVEVNLAHAPAWIFLVEEFLDLFLSRAEPFTLTLEAFGVVDMSRTHRASHLSTVTVSATVARLVRGHPDQSVSL